MLIDRARIDTVLPDHELGAELGRGGFGVVLAARHRRLGRDDAVKVLAADGQDRFPSVARILAELEHPHLVRVHDQVAEAEMPLLVMERVTGGSLADRLTEPCPPERACALGLAVADALAVAHGRGLIHRDLQPDNLLFAADGTVEVADVGIAEIFHGSATAANALLRTPLYLAPEQITDGAIGPATDLYALGIVLYRLLAGYPPVPEGTPSAAVLEFHRRQHPPPLTGAPPEVAEVVLRALEKDPTARQPTARDFAYELADAAGAAFGPGWPSRASLPLHVDESVRERILRAASRPVRSSEPLGPLFGPPPPEVRDELATGDDDEPRRRRPLLLLVCVALAAVVAAVGAVVAVSRHGGLSPFPAEHLRGVDSIAVDGHGRLYVSLPGRGIVQRIARDGTAKTVAGATTKEREGAGRRATATPLKRPRALAVDPDGTLYVADDAVEEVTPDGRIRTVALMRAVALAAGRNGRVYLCDDTQIFQTATNPYLAVVAGTRGKPGFAGDGGPAIDALLHSPSALAVGPDGTLYVLDAGNKRFRRIDPDGRIRSVVAPGVGSAVPVALTVARDGTIYAAYRGSKGDQILAFPRGPTRRVASGVLPRIAALAADGAGTVYFRDATSQRSVWKIRTGERPEQVEVK
jgi:serine/threonine-protein kinase